jgi:hypothetical protein
MSVLSDLEKVGARRCPRCQYVIIKEGGCTHMFCEQCYQEFDWRQAERVHLPQKYPTISGASSREDQGIAGKPAENHMPPSAVGADIIAMIQHHEHMPLTWAQHIRRAMTGMERQEAEAEVETAQAQLADGPTRGDDANEARGLDIQENYDQDNDDESIQDEDNEEFEFHIRGCEI